MVLLLYLPRLPFIRGFRRYRAACSVGRSVGLTAALFVLLFLLVRLLAFLLRLLSRQCTDGDYCKIGLSYACYHLRQLALVPMPGLQLPGIHSRLRFRLSVRSGASSVSCIGPRILLTRFFLLSVDKCACDSARKITRLRHRANSFRKVSCVDSEQVYGTGRTYPAVGWFVVTAGLCL